MILAKPDFAPVYHLDVQHGRPLETVVGAGLEWLRNQPNSGHGILASDMATALRDLPKSPWLRSLNKVHARDTGIGAGGAGRPLLALFPTRDLLLKLTDCYADRVSAMCILSYGLSDRFPHVWLDWIGATDLDSGTRRSVSGESALDPVVETAFRSLRGQLTGQLCTPEHSSDPNGVATLLELQRRGHQLDANALAAWAITEGFSRHEVVEFVEHVRKVTKGHRYAAKTQGTWTPSYDKWVERSAGLVKPQT